MTLLIILLVTEFLTPQVIFQHFYKSSKGQYYILIVFHAVLSIWLWILFIEIEKYKSFYDTPQHVWMMMNMTGMLTGVVFPRVILIVMHFSGRLKRYKSGGHIKWLTNTGLTISLIIFLTIALSTLLGRFNFKEEKITIKINGLHNDLNGLKIVQLSDLHLAGFYHHLNLLQDVIDRVNIINPDLILNTGDFISYGWREFDRNDTIISKANSRYGNFAIMGNHDFGTYHPHFTEADLENNVQILNNMIHSSGYKILNDEHTIVKIGESKIAIIGVVTKGRHPYFMHGDLDKAMAGIDSADLKILLSHDPNHWEKSVVNKTDIDITLSGHTHGMQMGIITKRFRWSPSKYFYPHWAGLFSEGKQVHYVNRGLGVLAIPFRIWMPPEITIITLESE
jgi:hypothetical protein